MEFPNRKFYENKLKCSEKSKNYYLNCRVLEKYDSSSPLVFIDTSKHENNKESTLGYSHSYINDLEIEIVLDIIKMYLDNGINPKNIGVISPMQIKLEQLTKKQM